MKKQIVIRYKWNKRDEEKWLFFLEKKIQELGCEVTMLPITETDFGANPHWLESIQQIHGIATENTYFVEHDPGSLTILRYIEQLVRRKDQNPAALIAGHNLRKGEVSAGTDIQKYTGVHSDGEDVKLVVLYGGSFGNMIANPERLSLEAKNKRSFLSLLLGR